MFEYVYMCECVYVCAWGADTWAAWAPAAGRSSSSGCCSEPLWSLPFLSPGCPSGLRSEVTSQDAPVPRGGGPCSVLPIARAWCRPLETGLKEAGDLVSFVPVVPSALRQGSSRGTKIPFPSLRGHPWAQTRGPDSGPSEIIPMECHCGGHSPGPRSGGGCGQWPGPTLASCLWGEGGSQFACPPGVVFGVPAIWVSRITGSWCPELEVIWWSPPTFLGWSLNPQWDGIWKWGLCEVMGFR